MLCDLQTGRSHGGDPEVDHAPGGGQGHGGQGLDPEGQGHGRGHAPGALDLDAGLGLGVAHDPLADALVRGNAPPLGAALALDHAPAAIGPSLGPGRLNVCFVCVCEILELF